MGALSSASPSTEKRTRTERPTTTQPSQRKGGQPNGSEDADPATSLPLTFHLPA